MCMEVFPTTLILIAALMNFLHVHGGVSVYKAVNAIQKTFSPCAWRCFLVNASFYLLRPIFSMCMEVFLNITEEKYNPEDFLHVHGGVSNSVVMGTLIILFSPCAWRCFSPKRAKRRKRFIFSMCMEVFPNNVTLLPGPFDFLHVHGGVSEYS